MPLPSNFSRTDHFKSVYAKTHNKLVREAFSEDIDETDLASSEGALKQACLVDENDSLLEMLMRHNFFYDDVGIRKQVLRDEFYAIPKTDFQQTFHFLPQVQMRFEETKADVKLHKRRVPKRFRFSYRVLDFRSYSEFTQSDITRISNQIKTAFPSSFSHYCGLDTYNYYDPEKYDKRILVPARSLADAIKLLEKLTDLIGIRFVSGLITKKEGKYIPAKQVVILGETKPIPAKGITGNVKLRHARLLLHGLTEEIPLYLNKTDF